MDLLPSEEQSEIIDTVNAQLEADFDLHALAGQDFSTNVLDDDLWQRCAELGWFSLGLSEADGGIGYGLAEEALLFERIGAHATPGPFLPTVLGAHVAAAAGDADPVTAITSGACRVALAEPEPSADDPHRVRVTDHDGAALMLTIGERDCVLRSTEGKQFVAQSSLDPLVPLAVTEVDRDGADVVCRADGETLVLRATVLFAAELAGIARATAEQSTEYAKDREQFGRPVGSFQAVKHRCADMAVRADAAIQLTRLASLAVQAGHPDARFQARAARAVASEAAIDNAEVNVQNHGGIGFTYEHTAHRYVTRARLRAAALGGRAATLADMLAADAPS